MNVDPKLAVEDMKEIIKRDFLPKYRMCCARTVLAYAGYDNEEVQVVLNYIAERGFDYCLDSTILGTYRGEKQDEYPIPSVCVWGPDQLLSRLDCI